jgi:hypothetical protein
MDHSSSPGPVRRGSYIECARAKEGSNKKGAVNGALKYLKIKRDQNL